jgi:hypothetical protein
MLTIRLIVVKDDKGRDDNWVIVFACLPSDSTSPLVSPQCKLNATWPRGYGDIIWGEDNCLYEAGRTKIEDQCAETIVPTDAAVLVNNPYYVPPQQPPPQPQPSTVPQPGPAQPPNPYPLCNPDDIPGLNCDVDCYGYIRCPAWCYAMCGGID